MTRYQVPAGTDQERFVADAREALDALAARPGFRSGRVGRALDDPTHWTLITEWVGVGSYRRALSAYDVKVRATPLLARAVDEPSAFEVLLAISPDSDDQRRGSDRAADAEVAGPGRSSVPVAPRDVSPG